MFQLDLLCLLQPCVGVMDSSKQDSGSGGGVDPSGLVSEDGKNVKSVVCQRCGSKVLCPGMAVFAEKEVIFCLMNVIFTGKIMES